VICAVILPLKTLKTSYSVALALQVLVHPFERTGSVPALIPNCIMKRGRGNRQLASYDGRLPVTLSSSSAPGPATSANRAPIDNVRRQSQVTWLRVASAELQDVSRTLQWSFDVAVHNEA